MEPTIGSADSTYLWLQRNAWRYDFVLQHRGQDIGTLKATSWSRQEFEGSTREGEWFLRQEGFWRREIVCEEAPARQRVASFKPNWSITGYAIPVTWAKPSASSNACGSQRVST